VQPGRGARLPFLSFYFIYYTARGIATLIIPLYFASVGIPIIEIGIALAVNGVSVLFFEILWGFLFDRFGRTRLIPSIVLLTAIAYMIFPFIRTAPGAISIEILYGVSAPALAVAMRSIIIGNSESTGWAQGFGLLGSVFSVSLVLGSLLGTATGREIGFEWSFFVMAGITIGALLIYRQWTSRQDTFVPVHHSTESHRPRLSWMGLPLFGLVAIPLFMNWTFFTSIMQIVVTKTASIGASTFEAGLLVTLFFLSTAIFQPLFSRWGASRAKLWIAVALLANFTLFVMLTLTRNIWAIEGLAFAAGACFSAISPLSLSLMMVGVPERYVGTAMGLYGAAEDIGIILGPLVTSYFWIQYSLNDAYLSVGAAILLVLGTYSITVLRTRQQ
jgi:MFS family permease